MRLFNLESLTNTTTCFQSEKPSCIDLILPNKKSFQKLQNVGISHHHHLVLTSMTSQYVQRNPKIKFYRDYKSFNSESFNNQLNKFLKSEKDINYSLFENIFLQVINTHAPVRKKFKGWTKQLHKAIMHHSRLKNMLNKSRRLNT